MAKMKDVQLPADALKPDRMAGKKGFAGKQALISTMLETKPDDKPSLLVTSFDTHFFSNKSGRVTERELSDMVGAPMSIITERELNSTVGLDEADRFIAEMEGKKR
ncbi:MAG: hypothetical protein V1861_06760 [Candidatus Micrarchaeota archaeon]